ncbi:unnamed protein product (macronuclear) [Paramecium tetraurelia]|uniref:Uncharacterized protein n=1 Tax=Paramecium tetraurelia TaxID=5888 RepID=A0DRZ1_PARTE|nr:uncharacterized protein GSPATT00019512001 [Paramecium tetraurelia]CAK85808.1 unnamed protein product [Paramecium tetraurelia]|eukprot:XP_001453205.1 hypothetical protein (macronuclear) [Paramecium tetraurelia strain d4-2]
MANQHQIIRIYQLHKQQILFKFRSQQSTSLKPRKQFLGKQGQEISRKDNTILNNKSLKNKKILNLLERIDESINILCQFQGLKHSQEIKARQNHTSVIQGKMKYFDPADLQDAYYDKDDL